MKDFVNKKIGKLTIKSKTGTYEQIKMDRGKKRIYLLPIYFAICDCGKEVEIKQDSLIGNKPTKSCGCLRHNKDLIGLRYGRGLVIERLGITKLGTNKDRKKRLWKLKCGCGNEYTATTESLTSGSVSSCGCIRREEGSFYKNRTRRKYASLKSYFNSVKSGASKRGLEFDITLKDVENLLEKQKNKCILSGVEIDIKINASLDRIDSKKGYIKDNVQWVEKRINFMKHSMKEDEFIYLCKCVALNTNV